MNFNELVTEVISITRRPDLEPQIQAAVKAATIKAHHSDFYYRDLHEMSVEFAVEYQIQNFLPTDIFTNFRKAKYIRLWFGDVDGYAGKFLTPIHIENSIDDYSLDRVDVFYMAGQLLQIRTAAPIKRVLFGAYLHPVVTPESSYNSWIANEYPYAIVYEACRAIFKRIGKDSESAEFNRLTAEEYRLLLISNVDDVPLT